LPTTRHRCTLMGLGAKPRRWAPLIRDTRNGIKRYNEDLIGLFSWNSASCKSKWLTWLWKTSKTPWPFTLTLYSHRIELLDLPFTFIYINKAYINNPFT